MQSKTLRVALAGVAVMMVSVFGLLRACSGPGEPKRSAFDLNAFIAYPGSTYVDKYSVAGKPGRDLENRPIRADGTYYQRNYTLQRPIPAKQFWDWVYTTYPPSGWTITIRHDGRIPDGTVDGRPQAEQQGGSMVYEHDNYRGYAINRSRIYAEPKKPVDGYLVEYQVWGDCKRSVCGTIAP
jgi:hypothetical protein